MRVITRFLIAAFARMGFGSLMVFVKKYGRAAQLIP
jgi:hypothetical protein